MIEAVAAHEFHIPRLRTMARHAVPHVIEGTILPLGAFLLGLKLFGLVGALVAALAWAYGATFRRLLTGQRVSGLLILALVTLTARAAIALATGSLVVYFLQPTIGTALLGAAFLLSVPAGRPLTEKLAKDFCPIRPETLKHPPVRRFFLRLCLLWAFVNLANAGIALWLLLSQSIVMFVMVRSLTGPVLTALAIAISVQWFRKAMANNGVKVRFGNAAPA